MTTPEELYRRYLDGDQPAFEELVVLFRRPVTGFIWRFLADEHSAEDVAQDVFVTVLEKPHYRFSGSFRAWLFGIARHKAIDYIRRHRRTLPLSELTDRPDGAPGPEETVLASERRRQVNDLLLQLKDDRRLALLLTAGEGLSYEETAAVLHKTPDQIRNLCHRGRQQLRQAMKEVSDDD